MASSLYAALLGIILVILSVKVIKRRRKQKVAIGDQGEETLQRLGRAQGNFAEYTPLFLIMLAMAEYQQLPVWGVHLIGAAFVIGRISYAYGLIYAEQGEEVLKANYKFRVFGMMMTFTSLGILSSILLIQYVL
ncbi:MAG: MAPEG family protein [Rickettsiales bacterium]|nr:MAPEG family protein [Rickettsiales bacterium]